MDCLEVSLGHKNELAHLSYLIGCIRCNGKEMSLLTIYTMTIKKHPNVA